MSSPFQPGMTHELKVKTQPEDSAQKFYPHLPDVFATPFLVGLMERVSAELINMHLQPGEQSVGIAMDLKHMAATPLGHGDPRQNRSDRCRRPEVDFPA